MIICILVEMYKVHLKFMHPKRWVFINLPQGVVDIKWDHLMLYTVICWLNYMCVPHCMCNKTKGYLCILSKLDRSFAFAVIAILIGIVGLNPGINRTTWHLTAGTKTPIMIGTAEEGGDVGGVKRDVGGAGERMQIIRRMRIELQGRRGKDVVEKMQGKFWCVWV